MPGTSIPNSAWETIAVMSDITLAAGNSAYSSWLSSLLCLEARLSYPPSALIDSFIDRAPGVSLAHLRLHEAPVSAIDH